MTEGRRPESSNGTGERRFDPRGVVRRDQMATFLVNALRALDG